MNPLGGSHSSDYFLYQLTKTQLPNSLNYILHLYNRLQLVLICWGKVFFFKVAYFLDLVRFYQFCLYFREYEPLLPGLSAVRQMPEMIDSLWQEVSVQPGKPATTLHIHMSSCCFLSLTWLSQGITAYYNLPSLCLFSISSIKCSLTSTKVTSPGFQCPPSSMSLSNKCLLLYSTHLLHSTCLYLMVSLSTLFFTQFPSPSFFLC